MGDFNKIVAHSEKYGAAPRTNRQMVAFRDSLEVCQLSDMGFIGSKYTWCNNRTDHGFTKEHLDRAVADSSWCKLFGSVDVVVLVCRNSNHCPILVNFGSLGGTSHRRQYFFRFEAS